MTFIETPYQPGFKQGYVPFVVTEVVVPGVAFFSVVWASFISPTAITNRSIWWRPSAPDYHIQEVIVERRLINPAPALSPLTIQMQHESVAGFFGADFVIAGGAQGSASRVGNRRRYSPALLLPFTSSVPALGNQGIRPMITNLTSGAAGDYVSITVHITQGTPA